MPVWTTCDVFAPGIALGHAVGRLGCLAAGCCYGKPTQVAWAVTFTDPAAALNVGTPLNVPLHPTQLYEALAGFVILIVLLALERRRRPFAGRTFWQFVLMYAVSRFVIEFYRGDDRGMMSVFSTSQVISLVLAPLSVVMLAWLGRAAASPAVAAPPRRR
jgi:phosphatidylglycerol:prolipoprotein diacylglycerol transferase